MVLSLVRGELKGRNAQDLYARVKKATNKVWTLLRLIWPPPCELPM